MYYVYILGCIREKKVVVYYTGYTNNLDRRVSEHQKNAQNNKRKKYTGRFDDVILLWDNEFKTKEEAVAEEKRIKKMNKLAKTKLIQEQR
ncbi:MAG: GIY-YIG nuclease family protein [Candidatus Altiarchaeota archaeon]|nr:GIY-YIG nuclease family protein [Candidatus Altiarchaeota archaeon]